MRYVILEHDHPERHWDLMLERGGVLATWRLAEPPRPGRPVAAAASFDHRPLYLDYEGPVSGGRGSVTRWDAGAYAELAAEGGALRLRLRGRRLNGTAALTPAPGGAWSLLYTEGSGEGGIA
jgi:hypothetical protein